MMSWCLLKSTAATEIYTYRHTLSLHDALPVFSTLAAWPEKLSADLIIRATCRCSRAQCRVLTFIAAPCRVDDYEIEMPELSCGFDILCNAERSEEHTSELQSLMRISYVVFSLKYNILKLLLFFTLFIHF